MLAFILFNFFLLQNISQIINKMTNGEADDYFECVGITSFAEDAYACCRNVLLFLVLCPLSFMHSHCCRLENHKYDHLICQNQTVILFSFYLYKQEASKLFLSYIDEWKIFDGKLLTFTFFHSPSFSSNFRVGQRPLC